MAFEVRRSRRIRTSGGRSRKSDEAGGLPKDVADSGNIKLVTDAKREKKSISASSMATYDIASHKLHSKPSIFNRRYHVTTGKSSLRLDTNALHAGQGLLTAGGFMPPSSANDLRHLHFQKFREYLWQQGRRYFGDGSAADAFVLPVQLPGGEAQLDSLGRGVCYGTVRVHTVIHSEGQSPIGMAREFDLASLRATVPEPTPTPRTPNFDSKGLLSALMDVDTETPEAKSATFSRSIERTRPAGGRRRTRNSAPLQMSHGVPIRTYLSRPYTHSHVIAPWCLVAKTLFHARCLHLPFLSTL